MSKVAISGPVSIWQLGAPLGEGPVWVERDQALWFVDIKSHKIHRYDPVSGATRSWNAPGQVGFILPIESGGFVAGLQTGLSRFDERDGSFTHICAPEPDLPTNRLNDATVDPQGRLWFGSMDDGESDITGAIYRLGATGLRRGQPARRDHQRPRGLARRQDALPCRYFGRRDLRLRRGRCRHAGEPPRIRPHPQ
jgi:D-xylonolactonase